MSWGGVKGWDTQLGGIFKECSHKDGLYNTFAYVSAFYRSVRNIHPFHCNMMSFIKSRLRFLLLHGSALISTLPLGSAPSVRFLLHGHRRYQLKTEAHEVATTLV